MRRLSTASFLVWAVGVTAVTVTAFAPAADTTGNRILPSQQQQQSALLSSSSVARSTWLLRAVADPLQTSSPENAAVSAEEEEDATSATATTPSSSTSTSSSSSSSSDPLLNVDDISKLRFRELRQELSGRELSTEGTTGQLRDRLRQDLDQDYEDCIVNSEDGIDDDCEPSPLEQIVTFIDESNPGQDLMEEIQSRAERGHWKAATRKLKKLTRWSANAAAASDKKPIVITEALYNSVLDSCMEDRLQGARASEPARKILEQMVEAGYSISESSGNYCIKNCLGYTSKDSTHQGFGGVDTALAMVAAMEQSNTNIQGETYDRLCVCLAREGSVEHALTLLRLMVVDQSETPPLSTFALVAQAAIARPQDHEEEKVLSVLAYAKAAGYELDTIASIEDGRDILAAGVIAAERLDNVALGLRLLTAAGNAKGVAPDRGDTMVALSSSAAQRACQLIHKRAINKSVEAEQWKLAVTVLELMLERSLKPSSWVWRNVVTCCAKAERSKMATSLLLKWVKLAEAGKAEKPPISVFNTCVNACEICDEHELVFVVLDSMQKTHKTEGNLITSNIALKRLAKQGDYRSCEGIVIGMLQAGVEPSVVSYTTAIAACASSEPKQAKVATEWIKRMRTRNVSPNVLTYNTALSACLDGTLASTFLGSTVASEMMNDCEKQLQLSDKEMDKFTNVVPDATTKFLARKLMEQLKDNWLAGDIDKRVATDTVRVPLRLLLDFQKSEVAARVKQKADVVASAVVPEDEDDSMVTRRDEVELEYQTTKRSAEV